MISIDFYRYQVDNQGLHVGCVGIIGELIKMSVRLDKASVKLERRRFTNATITPRKVKIFRVCTLKAGTVLLALGVSSRIQNETSS